VRTLLEKADVRIDGDRPWDIRVHDNRLYRRIIANGSLGLGEAYMDGWWDCERLDEFFSHILRTELGRTTQISIPVITTWIRSHVLNEQTLERSKSVTEKHYDLGNDFYQAMLDPNMQYSCGYFKDTNDLSTAQEQKLDLICRKLQLRKDDHVLDIGCGWGGFARFAAQRYGCHVTATNISKEQMTFARHYCKGLPVDLMECDYRDIAGTYDKIVSVGMFEHVGFKNYDTFLDVAHSCLKDDGIFLLHSIGSGAAAGGADPWIQKYIFPNSILPTMSEVTASAVRHFVLEDWHNFGAYYDKTLMVWFHNFEKHWPVFRERFGERFERMWRYYLLSCAGAFRARSIHLWQIVLTPHGMEGGYESVR